MLTYSKLISKTIEEAHDLYGQVGKRSDYEEIRDTAWRFVNKVLELKSLFFNYPSLKNKTNLTYEYQRECGVSELTLGEVELSYNIKLIDFPIIIGLDYERPFREAMDAWTTGWMHILVWLAKEASKQGLFESGLPREAREPPELEQPEEPRESRKPPELEHPKKSRRKQYGFLNEPRE
jgi:hypothetical protein